MIQHNLCNISPPPQSNFVISSLPDSLYIPAVYKCLKILFPWMETCKQVGKNGCETNCKSFLIMNVWSILSVLS